MGIICFAMDDPYREYIQTKLISCLEKDVEYYFEFYVCLADHSYYAINRIGALFTDDAIFQNDYFVISATPQISNPLNRIITDTLNWTKISGSFVAQGGECYMTIGNFYEWYNCDTAITNPNINEVTYYFIDGVSLILCDTCNQGNANTIYIPNIFSPNSDGVNDELYVMGKNIQQINFSVYNRWGEQVFISNDISIGWDGKYKGKLCDAAVYVYYAKIVFKDGTEQIKKGNITLVR